MQDSKEKGQNGHADDWFCPLYNRAISEGLCLDINYERIEFQKPDLIPQIQKITGNTIEEVADICLSCKHRLVFKIYMPLIGNKKQRMKIIDACPLGGETFLICEQDYDQVKETWKFIPGDTVNCEVIKSGNGVIFQAVSKVEVELE